MDTNIFQKILNEQLENNNLSMVEIDLVEYDNAKIEVSSVETVEALRGQGNGRKAMSILTGLADLYNKNLILEIAGDEEDEEDYCPDGLPGFWILKEFYESCGFDYIGNGKMIYKPGRR